MNIDNLQNVLKTQPTTEQNIPSQQRQEEILQDVVVNSQESPIKVMKPTQKKKPLFLLVIVIGVLFTLGSVAFAYTQYTAFMGGDTTKPIASNQPIPSPTPMATTQPSIEPSPTTKLTPTPSPTPKTTPKPSPSPSPSPTPTATPNTTIDLSIDDLTFEDPQTNASIATPFTAGQRISVRAKLKNTGSSDTPIFSSNWIVNGEKVGINTSGKVKANSDAVYDDINSIVYANFYLKQGQNTITYVVDPDNKMNESNRGNNTKTTTLEAGPSKIDLQVMEINLYEQGTYNKVTIPISGQKLTARAKIVNTGEVKASQFSQAWFVNGNKVKDGTFTTWAVKDDTQETTTLSYDFTPSSGETKLKFEINMDKSFPEVSLSNNTLERAPFSL